MNRLSAIVVALLLAARLPGQNLQSPKTADDFCAAGEAELAKKPAPGQTDDPIEFRHARATDALADFDRALVLDPKSARAFRGRSSAKIFLHDRDGALADLNRSIELDPRNAEAYDQRAQLDSTHALADRDRAVELDPKSQAILYDRAMNRYNMRDYNGALADFNRIFDLGPVPAQCFYYRSLVKKELGDLTGADADLKAAIKLDPECGKPHPNIPGLPSPLRDTVEVRSK